jgi:hypothetical protein
MIAIEWEYENKLEKDERYGNLYPFNVRLFY